MPGPADRRVAPGSDGDAAVSLDRGGPKRDQTLPRPSLRSPSTPPTPGGRAPLVRRPTTDGPGGVGRAAPSLLREAPIMTTDDDRGSTLPAERFPFDPEEFEPYPRAAVVCTTCSQPIPTSFTSSSAGASSATRAGRPSSPITTARRARPGSSARASTARSRRSAASCSRRACSWRPAGPSGSSPCCWRTSWARRSARGRGAGAAGATGAGGLPGVFRDRLLLPAGRHLDPAANPRPGARLGPGAGRAGPGTPSAHHGSGGGEDARPPRPDRRPDLLRPVPSRDRPYPRPDRPRRRPV